MFSESYLRQVDLDPSMFQHCRSTVSTHLVTSHVGGVATLPPTGAGGVATVCASPDGGFSALLPTQRPFLGSAFVLKQPNSRILELDLSGCSRLASENFPLIAMACPSLQVLRLIGCSQVRYCWGGG